MHKQILCFYAFEQARSALDTATQSYRSQLAALDNGFSVQNNLFRTMIQPLMQKMDDLVQKRYDRFFEIDAMIENDLNVLQKNIALYEQELSEVNRNFQNLITHCYAHGERIYGQLRRLAESSAVRLTELARKVHMLKIELPEQVDEKIAKERMKTYVETEAEKLAQAIRSQQPRSALIKKAGTIVSSRTLLNTVIGKTSIPVKVFNIDMDMQNSDYRPWENAISANSGGEKFVVYFAVILSLMYYTNLHKR